MKCSELKRLLSRAGWFVIRRAKGSHSILGHPDRPDEEITFADHGSAEVSKKVEQKILKQMGLK
ncbi:addiction module toxin, HicA family [Chitinophaga sp. SYP-B3965]|uniref:type II toxin-antitoxin system HicA family toxin n=1 Tax=Chitinophaga sp. SYP-B3965 TaxID=2663120 RepID=UPI00129A058F|nr:type II toxin-antitoxin system HicA family toxin [Chitinophaga sp. SYP-B3965]MRG44295.1 addiction module toxin, HicA family [Chitinophaga sp. SYP-B3965]